MSAVNMSVLTLVKNRASHLAQLIEGLRRSEAMPAELIVVDMNGGWVPPRSCFPIRVIDMPSAGLPLARSRNAAAVAARSENLLFLDVDCIPMRSLIRGMTDCLSQTDGLICAPVRYLGPAELGEHWDEQSLLSVAQPHPVRAFPATGLKIEANAGLFWSLAFAVRRAVFTHLGGFDEAFDGYGAEDTDLGFRARRAGVALYFSGGPGAFHQYHDVFDPPLQHFRDIVANAITFHGRWNVWPMEGWLERFAAMGLIELSSSAITILRAPTGDEIANARKQRRF